jgi:SAM-dependent methyltransferase
MGYFDYGYFSYKKSKKDTVKKKRKNLMRKRTVVNRILANDLDKKFYDGERINGYGGFKYDERWKVFLKKIIHKYKLNKDSLVLDIGCKKGFFIKDLQDLVPGITVYGIEDHKYPITKSLLSVRKNIKYVNSYYDIKFKKNYFDFVHAHNSIYRYSLRDMIKVIKKIIFISKKSHITVPVYYNENERSKFLDWSLLGGVILKEKDWKQMFKFLNYKGDYYLSGAKSYGL